MRTLLAILTIATIHISVVSAVANNYSALMSPVFFWGTNHNEPLYATDGAAGQFGIFTSPDLSSAGGPSVCTDLWGGDREFVIDPGQGNPLWLTGTLHVGFGVYGPRDLIVTGSITAGPEGAAVPRWLGIQSSDPTATAGDTYKNSTTGKIRLYDGTAWNDLN